MSKHTPGPWYSIVGQDIVVPDGAGAQLVAQCHAGHAPERAANARLIAAAPEMLEALKGMLEWARRCKELNPGMEVANAVNAINKATGE